MSRTHRLAVILAVFCCLPAILNAQEQPDPMALIRTTVENDKANDKKAVEYMYVERREERKKHGKETRTEVRTRETFVLYGHEMHRLIGRDDKPLSEKEARKEEERITELIEKYKNEGDSEHRKQEAKLAKEREQERAFLDEVAQAFNFQIEPSETVHGRPTWVIRGAPRSDFHAKSKEAKILPKLRFKVWIDREESQWAKIEIEFIDNVSFGWFLAKLDRGAHLVIEQARVNDEIWLPQHVAVNADARLLFKHVSADADITYRDYRKFRTESRITIPDPQVAPPPPLR